MRFPICDKEKLTNRCANDRALLNSPLLNKYLWLQYLLEEDSLALAWKTMKIKQISEAARERQKGEEWEGGERYKP